MKDFTLEAYEEYLKAIKSSYSTIIRFDEYFLSKSKPDSFCLIRHDVDRKPGNALRMAEVESDLGLHATYYFRTRWYTFKPDIIRRISSLGHEIGYHYESLSDTNGDIQKALTDFESNLAKFRTICDIKTIAMHGQPIKKIDNRDLWRKQSDYKDILASHALLGEVYLDIDYSDILYVNDTGRNWKLNESNLRDYVESNLRIEFNDGPSLKEYLANDPNQKLVFQIHPERWASSPWDYAVQFIFDSGVNTLKKIL